MRLNVIISCLFLAFNAHSIETISKHHLHLGFNTYYRDYSEIFIGPHKSDENGLLYGLSLGYEHKAPNCFMFSADLGFDMGETKYDGSLQNQQGAFIAYQESTTANVFLGFDSNFGYTFSNSPSHLITPYIGYGNKAWGRGLGGFTEIYGWNYISVGLQYDLNLNQNYRYGLNVKIMQMLDGIMKADDASQFDMTLGNKTHFELSFPVLYKTDPENPSYWRFTPYYQYQRFGESDRVPGYLIDQYIFEPASRTHIFGVKVEYGFGF